MSMMSIILVQIVMLFYMQMTYCYWRRQYQNLKNYYMRVKTFCQDCYLVVAAATTK